MIIMVNGNVSNIFNSTDTKHFPCLKICCRTYCFVSQTETKWHQNREEICAQLSRVNRQAHSSVHCWPWCEAVWPTCVCIFRFSAFSRKQFTIKNVKICAFVKLMCAWIVWIFWLNSMIVFEQFCYTLIVTTQTVTLISLEWIEFD